MSLEQKVRGVLAQLSTLSEASASLEPRASQSAPESSIPAGVSLRDRPPSKRALPARLVAVALHAAVVKGESEFEQHCSACSPSATTSTAAST